MKRQIPVAKRLKNRARRAGVAGEMGRKLPPTGRGLERGSESLEARPA
jgi:hypothetical protein